MQIVINSYGSYIRKQSECFVVGVKDKKQEIPARKVQSIMVTTSAMISTDAILLAHEHNVDIIFLNQYGKPFSRVWHSRFGSTTYIRRKQLEFSGNWKGLDLAKGWILQKLDNQTGLLEKLKKTRKNKAEKIESYVESMSRSRDKLASLEGENIDDVRGQVFAFEAICGKIYFEALNFIMPEQYRFSGRSRNPAKDEFNAFLNYGYGILYSKMERACILSGLDPFIGFLHTDNYGKRSFVFDVIELFRIHVDEIVIRLFSKRMVKQGMCRAIQNGLMLDKEGKELLISEFNKEMEGTMRYRGRNIRKANIMEYECHRLANGFIGRDKDVSMGDVRHY